MNLSARDSAAGRVAGEIFTIGHSNHTGDEFLALLRAHSIQTVADVRSSPYGRNRHFDREFLAAALSEAGIEYLFLGRELGARRDEAAAYVGDRADYDLIAGLPQFQAGIARLLELAPRRRVALMCAEKEPLDCHRTILVSRRLAAAGFSVRHILADSGLENHEDSERRLVKLMKIMPDLFDPDFSEAHLIERAYAARGLEIAYVRGREIDE